jgi:hypothetical protein
VEQGEVASTCHDYRLVEPCGHRDGVCAREVRVTAMADLPPTWLPLVLDRPTASLALCARKPHYVGSTPHEVIGSGDSDLWNEQGFHDLKRSWRSDRLLRCRCSTVCYPLWAVNARGYAGFAIPTAELVAGATETWVPALWVLHEGSRSQGVVEVS